MDSRNKNPKNYANPTLSTRALSRQKSVSFKPESIEPTDCRGEVIAPNVSPRRQTFEAKFEKWRQIKYVED